MKVPLQVILAILFVFFSRDSVIAQQTRAPEKGPALRIVYFLSNALARDHHLLYSRIIFSGDLDGAGIDKIIGNRSQKQNVYLYTLKNGILVEIDSILEKGTMFAGVAADIDGDSRKELIYYELMGDAFVVIRQDLQRRISRRAFNTSVNAQPDALGSGKFFDPKQEVLVMDVMWKGEEEAIYDGVVFFTWDGKAFRQGPKVRLEYNVMGLVALDINKDGREELLILGDEAMEKCYLEVYTAVAPQGVKRLAQYTVPIEGCLGAKLVLVRAFGHPYLLLVDGLKIYEVRLPTETATEPSLELRATLHMDADSAAAGDIDGDGDQELLIVASRPKPGPPDTGFFIYKFFPQ